MGLHLKIKEERKRNGLTQEKLGEKVGVTKEMIGRWEREEALPTLENCKKLRDVFGVTIDYLINDDIISKNDYQKYATFGQEILTLSGEKYPVDFIKNYYICSKETSFSIPRKQAVTFLEKVEATLKSITYEDIEQVTELYTYMKNFIFSWYKFSKGKFLLSKEQKGKSLLLNAILYSEDEIESAVGNNDYSEKPIMLLRNLIIQRLNKELAELNCMDEEAWVRYNEEIGRPAFRTYKLYY